MRSAALCANVARDASDNAASENPSAPQPPTDTRIFNRGLRMRSACRRARAPAAPASSSATRPSLPMWANAKLIAVSFSAAIGHEADLPAVVFEFAGQAHVAHAIEQLLVRRETIGLANLGAQREAQTVDVADLRVPLLQIAQPFEEVPALGHDHRFVIGLGQHLHRLEADRRAERI